MKIYEFYYDQDRRSLYIEFSTKSDGDKFFRRIDITFNDIEFYSPTIITEFDMTEIDKSFIVELLEQYFIENELPEEEIL